LDWILKQNFWIGFGFEKRKSVHLYTVATFFEEVFHFEKNK